MPRKIKPRRNRGDTRTVSKTRKPTVAPPPSHRDPVQALRTQTRGGRPPRFPGRTGGR